MPIEMNEFEQGDEEASSSSSGPKYLPETEEILEEHGQDQALSAQEIADNHSLAEGDTKKVQGGLNSLTDSGVVERRYVEGTAYYTFVPEGERPEETDEE